MFRIIQDPALDGPTNLARDEALLHAVGRRESPPTLRMYQWEPPTISLGYFQPYAEYKDLPPPAGALSVVRRPTGGGAILHDLELTYSLVLPRDHDLFGAGVHRLYELAHAAVMACLSALDLRPHRADALPAEITRRLAEDLDERKAKERRASEDHVTTAILGEPSDSRSARDWSPFFCFARRHRFDVLVGDGKIAGSAQRRTREAVLQHGSIILGNRYEQQATARVAVPFGHAVAMLRGALPGELAEQTGEAFASGAWSAAELSAAAALLAKYQSPLWTQQAVDASRSRPRAEQRIESG